MTTLGEWFRTRKHHAREVNDYLAVAHGPSRLDVWDGAGTPGPLTAARIDDDDDDLMADCADVLQRLDAWDMGAWTPEMLDRLAADIEAQRQADDQRAQEIALAAWIMAQQPRRIRERPGRPE